MSKKRISLLGLAILLLGTASPAQIPLVDGKNAYRPATAADTQRLEEAAPTKPTAVPLQPRKVLIFQKTTWPAVMLVDDAFKIMGKKSGAFEVTTITDDASVMTPEWLRKFDMIVLNNTNELRLDDVQTQALQDFVRNGKGVIALGSAISSQFWAEQAEMLGGYCYDHPWEGNLLMEIEDPSHPLTRMFPREGIKIEDLIYQVIGSYSRENSRVLITLDVKDPQVARSLYLDPAVVRLDHDFAVSWIRDYGKGRVFVSLFPHTNQEMLFDPAVLQFFLDGAQFALGDLEVDTTPLPLRGDSVQLPGDPSAESLLHAAFMVMLQDKDPRARIAALRGLGEMGAAPKAPVLAIMQLTQDRAPSVREAARSALAAIRSSARETIPVMTEKLQIKDVRTQENAIDYIASMAILPEAQPAIPVIAQMLRENASFNVRQRAIMAFGNMGSSARPAVPALLKLLQDGNASTRGNAALALGGIGSSAAETIPALAKLLRDKESYPRVCAADALGNMGSAAVSTLTAVLQDKDAEWILRIHAAASLGKIGSVARIAVPALQQASRSDDYDIGRAANRALHKIK